MAKAGANHVQGARARYLGAHREALREEANG
jgi:hypothetical protein